MLTHLSFGISHTYTDRDNGIALPIVLSSGEQRIELTAMVDTGATFCLFERSFGDSLKLDVESGIRQEFRTAAGNFLAYGHEVTPSTLGIEVDSEEHAHHGLASARQDGRVPRPLEPCLRGLCAIVYFFADEAIRKNVLGRRGWLDRVRLAVVDYEQVLYLAPYDSPSQ